MLTATSPMRTPSFAALAALALSFNAGCGALEPLDTTGGSGGAGVPQEVRDAFAGSCATPGCHDAASRAGGLSLADADLEAIIGGPSSAGLPMVEIGDVHNSYLAIKLLPDDVLSANALERVGGRMPPTGDFTNPDNQTILAWIAGAEFPEGGGSSGSSGGETTGDGMITFGGEVWPLLAARCSCHLSAGNEPLNGNLSFPEAMAYANLVGAPSIDLPAMNEIEPNDPANSYLMLKVKGTHAAAGGAGDTMPLGSPLDAADVQLIEDWINAGAPM